MLWYHAVLYFGGDVFVCFYLVDGFSFDSYVDYFRFFEWIGYRLSYIVLEGCACCVVVDYFSGFGYCGGISYFVFRGVRAVYWYVISFVCMVAVAYRVEGLSYGYVDCDLSCVGYDYVVVYYFYGV